MMIQVWIPLHDRTFLLPLGLLQPPEINHHPTRSTLIPVCVDEGLSLGVTVPEGSFGIREETIVCLLSSSNPVSAPYHVQGGRVRTYELSTSGLATVRSCSRSSVGHSLVPAPNLLGEGIVGEGNGRGGFKVRGVECSDGGDRERHLLGTGRGRRRGEDGVGSGHEGRGETEGLAVAVVWENRQKREEERPPTSWKPSQSVAGKDDRSNRGEGEQKDFVDALCATALLRSWGASSVDP